MVLVLQAHPYPDRSRANRALARAIQGLEGLEVRSLYDLYPDFSIDVKEERRALLEARTVVWQHPIYWYAAPALLKLWFEKVLTVGFAYGRSGTALHGKRCLWVVTTGADETGYTPEGEHQYEFDAFVPVVKQTARFCGMKWLEPLLVHGAHKISIEALEEFGARYRKRLEELVREEAKPDA
jgi:glutathione-regulated potassium-efflux system ancillary protein KefF